MDQGSRNLVVVRCGDNSLHPNWCKGSRNWDLGISYFGKKDTEFPEARYVHRKAAGKWDGLFDFFASHSDCLNLYDYFWLPDDDIMTSAEDVNKLFEAMRRYELELAQPSLDSDSYFSHLVTLSNSAFRLRYLNFVEIMVPVLSQDLLRKTLSHFEGTRTGFGLDFWWPSLTSNPSRKVAILDEIAVTHTRPVGGELHKTASAGSVTGFDELASKMKATGVSGKAQVAGIPVPRIIVHAGIAKDGRLLDRPRSTAIPQAAAYLKLRSRSRQPISVLSIARYAAKHLMA